MNKVITLTNLAEATEQEVFDHVARHLLMQEMQSLDIYDKCIYHSPTGLKCAAGCLIADSEYKPEMEYKGWGQLVKAGQVPKIHANLIADLQHIHDNTEPKKWKFQLTKIAYWYSLSTDVLKEFK